MDRFSLFSQIEQLAATKVNRPEKQKQKCELGDGDRDALLPAGAATSTSTFLRLLLRSVGVVAVEPGAPP